MADVVTTIERLHDRLTDGSNGVNAKLDTRATRLKRIYSSLDAPKRSGETPYLLAAHFSVQPSQATSSKRDWEHIFRFHYKSGEADQDQRRKDIGWTVQALMQSLDPKNTQPSAVMSGVIQTEIQGAGMFWDLFADSRDEVLIAQVRLTTREEL